MDGTSPLGFLTGMGMAFNIGFVGLTATAIWQYVRIRELAEEGADTVERVCLEVLTHPAAPRTMEVWKGLGRMKGDLCAAASRANLTTACIPTLALFGTVLGFYYAIVTTGGLELATSDPLAILRALMDGGVKTALAFPTVLVALFVYSWISRSAPLGSLNLLFTPAAIVIGQTLLIVPLITALVYGVLHPSIRTVHEEARLLGASPARAFLKTIVEARVGVTTAVMAGFGRVAAEIGISLMLGGNIRGVTRTVTTAIALETGQGNFPRAVALGTLLLLLVLLLNLGVQFAERPDRV